MKFEKKHYVYILIAVLLSVIAVAEEAIQNNYTNNSITNTTSISNFTINNYFSNGSNLGLNLLKNSDFENWNGSNNLPDYWERTRTGGNRSNISYYGNASWETSGDGIAAYPSEIFYNISGFVTSNQSYTYGFYYKCLNRTSGYFTSDIYGTGLIDTTGIVIQSNTSEWTFSTSTFNITNPINISTIKLRMFNGGTPNNGSEWYIDNIILIRGTNLTGYLPRITDDHAQLTNLDFNKSGHVGFASSLQIDDKMNASGGVMTGQLQFNTTEPTLIYSNSSISRLIDVGTGSLTFRSALALFSRTYTSGNLTASQAGARFILNMTNALCLDGCGVSALSQLIDSRGVVTVGKFAFSKINDTLNTTKVQFYVRSGTADSAANTIAFEASANNFTVPILNGTGNAYACIDSSGNIIRSLIACDLI